MKTIEELKVLSKTREGMQQINAIVAKLCGGDEPITKWKFKWRMSPKFSDWNEYPCFSAKESAESARNEEIASGCEATEVESYLFPAVIQDYVWSLDDIMPVIRKMGDELWDDYLFHLEALCGTDGWQIMGLNERWSIATAEAVQHCIAFILTRQQITTDKI